MTDFITKFMSAVSKHYIFCKYKSVNGIAPSNNKVDEMIKALECHAEAKGMKLELMANTNYHWENELFSDDLVFIVERFYHTI